jgi:hypothetical protein
MAGVRRPPPPGVVALDVDASGSPAIPAPTQTVDFDFTQAPPRDLLYLVAIEMETPILVDPAIDTPVDISGREIPVLAAFDDILAKARAQRFEVAAVRLVTTGGRSDADALGGDPISIHVNQAPLSDVLAVIETGLHMPIGRLAVPGLPPCEPGTAIVDGREVLIVCGDSGPAPDPRVTIDVTGLPAGAVLASVLAQLGLRYELTTGFVVTPVD